MTTRRLVAYATVLLVIVAFVPVIVAEQHRPRPLDARDKEMMKNMAMRNMDKYMANMEAMQQLPARIKEVQDASIARGKALFESQSALSTNSMACASCHPGGGTTGGEVETPMPSEVTGQPYMLPVPSLVGSAATFPKFKIPNDAVITIGDMSNNCIMMFMMAKPLDPGSREFKDLSAYLTTLSEGTEIEVGKMPAMMMR